MSKELIRAMESLHEELVRELRRRIEGGTATAADLVAAIRLLKDNNITVNTRAPEHSLSALSAAAEQLLSRLPFTDQVN